jgi:hypothetical protein
MEPSGHRPSENRSSRGRVNQDSKNPKSAKGYGLSKVGGTGVRDWKQVGISQVEKSEFSRARESRSRKS